MALRPELQQQIRRAETLLSNRELNATRTLGERLQRDLPPEEKWVGWAILARFHCVQQQLAAIKAHLVNVPPGHRPAVVRFCKKAYPGYTP